MLTPEIYSLALMLERYIFLLNIIGFSIAGFYSIRRIFVVCAEVLNIMNWMFALESCDDFNNVNATLIK